MIGGELVTALAEATDARLVPVDSEHSALYQLIRCRAGARNRDAPGADRLRRPLPGPHRPGGGERRRRPRPPDLGHGRAHHDRLGDPDEQGLRDDRGPPPLRRPLRAHRRRRAPAVDRPLARPPERRRLARPPRLPGHEGARSPTRCTFPSGRTWTCPRWTWPRSGSSSSKPPDTETFPCLRLAREAGEVGGTAPCVLNAADEVAVGAFLEGRIPFTGIAEVIDRCLDEVPTGSAGPLRAAVRDRRAPPGSTRAG